MVTVREKILMKIKVLENDREDVINQIANLSETIDSINAAIEELENELEDLDNPV